MSSLRPIKTRAELSSRLAELRSMMKAAAPPLPDDPQAKAARLERARRDVLYFAETYLPHYVMCAFAEFHRELVSKLDVRATPMALAAPRGHAKSTICTLFYPLHQVIFGQRHFIIIGSETETQATGFTAFIREELASNERIAQDFGPQRREDGSEWAEGDFTTRGGVRVMARGRGQSIRGLRNRQHRPDLILLDDIEDDTSVKNPRLVKALIGWVLKAVYPSLHPDGSLFIIGTLLSKKSALAQLLEKKDVFTTGVYRALLPDGSALWPERWPVEKLERARTVMGRRAFNQEFLNLPDDESALFPEEWIRYYHPTELAGVALEVYAYIDPSVGSGESSDFKATITVGVERTTGVIYVLDAWVRHASIDAMVRSAYRRHEDYRVLRWGLEGVAFQKLLIRDFDREAQSRGYHLPIRAESQTVNKEMRIAGMQPLIERGLIRFCKGQGDQDLLVEQLTNFPNANVNDDAPDALEGAVRMANVAAWGAPRVRSRGRLASSSLLEQFERMAS